MSPRDRIADYLDHYMSRAWKAAGLAWDSDHHTEMQIIADQIVHVAEQAARDAVLRHLNSDPHLYPDGSRA